MRTPLVECGMLALVMMTFCVGSAYPGEPVGIGRHQSAVTNQRGVYFTGVYPDLFADVLGKPRAVTRARIDSTFHQLYYGDDRTERVYYPFGSDMAYIVDIGNNDVRTEGMSYGMMIAVQMNKKEEFDRLWKWAKTFMQFTNGPHKGYFAWHCRTDGTVLDSTAASDGEEWFVMSLFFASARWGEGEGMYAYRVEAQKILTTMLHKESEPGHGSVTNMFNAEEKLVAFVPAAQANHFTDPSYQVPHFYELWARWAERDNRFWCDVASASRRLLQRAADPVTGLSPDYAGFDGKPVSSRGGGHQEFRFDAWRVVMNVAIDWVWFEKDGWEVTQSNRLLDFFHSQGVRDHGNQYTLDGRKLGDDHSAGLVAMNAVAGLVSTNNNRKDFVEELWNTPVPTGLYRYYDGMLYMLAMLQVSGNFRIYDPTGNAVPACSQ
jgi:oligosaccharide reducing-end xylanase